MFHTSLLPLIWSGEFHSQVLLPQAQVFHRITRSLQQILSPSGERVLLSDQRKGISLPMTYRKIFRSLVDLFPPPGLYLQELTVLHHRHLQYPG